MPRSAHIVWLLLLSIVLTPFSTLHAHVASHHHESALHGGHLHHHDSAGDTHRTDEGRVIDVQLVGPPGERASVDFRTDWWPAFVVISAPSVVPPPAGLLLRPPAAEIRPTPHVSLWKPPLRGPPPVSITSL